MDKKRELTIITFIVSILFMPAIIAWDETFILVSPRNMTVNNTYPPPYVCTQSSFYNNEDFYGFHQAFHEGWGDNVAAAAGVSTGWWKIDLGGLYNASAFRMKTSGSAARNFINYTFEGSTNDVDWTVLKTVVGQATTTYTNFTYDHTTTGFFRYFKIVVTASGGVGYIGLNSFWIYSAPIPEDTCTCPSINTNWNISMADYCNITSACNLGTGKMSFYGSGYCSVNATINTTNLGDPGANGLLKILSNALIWVRGT